MKYLIIVVSVHDRTNPDMSTFEANSKEALEEHLDSLDRNDVMYPIAIPLSKLLVAIGYIEKDEIETVE